MEGIKLIKFYADWCGPCTMLTRVMKGEAFDSFDIQEVNVGDDDTKELQEQYGVKGIPLLVVLKDGVEVKRIQGFRPAPQILKELEDL